MIILKTSSHVQYHKNISDLCNIIRIFHPRCNIIGIFQLQHCPFSLHLSPPNGWTTPLLLAGEHFSFQLVNISLWLCHPSYEYKSLAFHLHHLSYIFMYIWTCYIFKWIYPYQYININMNMITERQNEKVTMVVIFRWGSTFGKATGRHSVSCNKFI